MRFKNNFLRKFLKKLARNWCGYKAQSCNDFVTGTLLLHRVTTICVFAGRLNINSEYKVSDVWQRIVWLQLWFVDEASGTVY